MPFKQLQMTRSRRCKQFANAVVMHLYNIYCGYTIANRQFNDELSVWELLMLSRPKRDAALIRQIKDWAYECLPISAEATVSVMELECHEPGCPATGNGCCRDGAREGNASVEVSQTDAGYHPHRRC